MVLLEEAGWYACLVHEILVNCECLVHYVVLWNKPLYFSDEAEVDLLLVHEDAPTHLACGGSAAAKRPSDSTESNKPTLRRNRIVQSMNGR